MPKFLIYTILILAVGLIVLNATKVDFQNLFEGDSIVALIGILAAACAIVMMLILLTAHRIKNKQK